MACEVTNIEINSQCAELLVRPPYNINYIIVYYYYMLNLNVRLQ